MNLMPMLGVPFLACLLLSLVLGYLGLHVLKREVIFIDIAVAQIAALGALARPRWAVWPCAFSTRPKVDSLAR